MRFDPEDFELLQTAVSISPELTAAVGLIKYTRQAGLTYPVVDVEQLGALLADGEVIACGAHRVDGVSVRRYMASEWFPIKDERRLLQRAHLALMRCLAETNDLLPERDERAEFGWVGYDDSGNEIARGS